MAGEVNVEAEQKLRKAMQAAITAAVDLPGLLGEGKPQGTAACSPVERGGPAWEQAAALRAQLGHSGTSVAAVGSSTYLQPAS